MPDESNSIDFNNPAARLQHWLLKARIVADNTAAMQRWCEVWGLDHQRRSGRHEAIIRGLAMQRLANESRRLASTDPMGAIVLEHFAAVEEVVRHFDYLGNVSMARFMSSMDDLSWHSLKGVAHLLTVSRPQPSISNSARSSLLDQVHDLISAVAADQTLTEPEKEHVLERLRDVETALLRSVVSGTVDVDRATDGLAGCLRRFTYRGREFYEHPVLKSVVALVAALTLASGTTADYLALQESPIGDMLHLPGIGTSESTDGPGD